MNSNKTIVKNSLLLYVRMFLTMLIGLYTSRVLLKALGVEDYGIYNIVGGITTMFNFINGSMAVASSRFIAFSIGKNDVQTERTVFKHILYIHYGIGLLIALLIETVGIWFLYNKLVIPEDRMNAAFWILQFSAITCFLNVICTPYNSMIISHEKMSSFAYISILESVLKLLICYMVMLSSSDKLIVYGELLMLESVLIRIIYTLYCRKKFVAVHGKVVLQKKMFTEIASFAGWNTLGNAALMTIEQGISILLNLFFGPVVNASRGIASQVINLISGFSSNIRMAINPQITKSYSQTDMKKMYQLIRMSSIYPFYMILACFIPIFLIGDFLLHLWLVDVPAYSLVFLRLGLLYTLVNSFANPIIIGIHATGRIRKFQIIEGILMLLTLPLAYIFLRIGLPAYSVYIASIVIAIVAQIGRVLVVLPKLGFSIKKYLVDMVLPCLKVSACGFIILALCSMMYDNNPITSFLLCLIFNCISILMIGFDKGERQKIYDIVMTKIKLQ